MSAERQRDKVLSGALGEVVVQPESGRPDFWVWLLLPAIGLAGSFIVVVAGWAGREIMGLGVGVWVWVLAVVVPGLLFVRDVHGYQVARRRGRRAGWQLRHVVAGEAAAYLQEQRAGTVRVEPVPERRFVSLQAGGQERLVALENAAALPAGQGVRWLQSPRGQRVRAGDVTRFLRRAYRVGSTARRQHEPAYMTRDEYETMMEFLVDCGLCEDRGQGGRPLCFGTFGEALAHLHLDPQVGAGG